MNFLNPALLWSLVPLVALPLLIHLLNRTFPRLFRFPSIEHIKATMARRSQLDRWRHLILLLLRTAFLLLLLLAFLKPVRPKFDSDPKATGDRHVVIVLDHSLSMEHRGGGSSARERAVAEAAKVIDALGARDLVNVVLMEQNPQTAFIEFSAQHGDAKRFLQGLKPGLGRGDLSQATALTARLLGKASVRPEVFFISDFQRKNWAAADFTALPEGARLFFVDVGARERDNRAILDARLSQSQILAGDTVPLEVTVGNFAAQPFDGRVTVSADRKLSMDAEVSVAPWSIGKVIVPVPAGAPGMHLCEVSLPADALDADNRFCLTLSVLEKEEVLIVTDAPADKQDSAYFLKTALNPYDDLRGSLLPKIISSREVTSSRLAGVTKILITDVGRLGEDAAAVLAKQMFAGAGLICFLDGLDDPVNLAALEKAMGPGTMPLRLTSRQSATNVTAGAQQVVRGDFKSRYLKLFRGATRQDLALLEFYDYWQAGATGAGNVLLTYADESPAFAATGHGLGTLLLLNFSPGEFSSNLARQRIFPAWMQELVKAVGGDEPPPTSHVVGEPLHTEVWRHEMRDAEFRDPAGGAVTVKRELQGERYAVSFTPGQTGFYTLGAPRPAQAFGVNPSPDESDLRPVAREMLPTATGSGRPSHFVAGREDYDDLIAGRPLFQWFLLAGVLFLLIEGGFQWLLGRRMPA